jgi:hypothetical protein
MNLEPEELDAPLEGLRQGDVAAVVSGLEALDNKFAARPGAAALRARGSILAMIEVLTQHAPYFAAG